MMWLKKKFLIYLKVDNVLRRYYKDKWMFIFFIEFVEVVLCLRYFRIVKMAVFVDLEMYILLNKGVNCLLSFKFRF